MFLTLSFLFLCQQPLLDDCGNPLAAPRVTTRAPGTVWSQVVANLSSVFGLAPLVNGDLLGASYNDGLAEVYEFEIPGGNVSMTWPVADDGDCWLGYDGKRELLLTTNATLDQIRTYRLGNPLPLSSVASPGSGPVGIAWDPIRDEYAVCDWLTDRLDVLDPRSFQVKRSFPLSATISRVAGVGYDCATDSYLVNGRDQNRMVAVDPVSGAIQGSWPTPAGNGGQGIAASRHGGAWTTDQYTTTCWELEALHGPQPALLIPARLLAGAPATALLTDPPSSDVQARWAWSFSPGHLVVHGLQTCLAPPYRIAGIAPILNGVGSLVSSLPATAAGKVLYIQGASLPSGSLTPLRVVRVP